MVSTWLAMLLVKAFSSYEDYNLGDSYEDTNLGDSYEDYKLGDSYEDTNLEDRYENYNQEDSYEDYNLGESFEDAALGESFEDTYLETNRNDVQRLGSIRSAAAEAAKATGKLVKETGKAAGKVGSKTRKAAGKVVKKTVKAADKVVKKTVKAADKVVKETKQAASDRNQRRAARNAPVEIMVKQKGSANEVLFVDCVLKSARRRLVRNAMKKMGAQVRRHTVQGKNGAPEHDYKCRSRLEYDSTGSVKKDTKPQLAKCTGAVNEKSDKLKEVTGCVITYKDPQSELDEDGSEYDGYELNAQMSDSQRQARRKLSNYERYF